MICTQKGRVVYNRRPTPFTYKDATRIVRKLETPGFLDVKGVGSLMVLLAVIFEKLNHQSPIYWLQQGQEKPKLTALFGGLLRFIAGLERQITLEDNF